MTSERLSTITPDLRESLMRTVTAFLELLKQRIETTNQSLLLKGERAEQLPDSNTTKKCVLAVANHLDWHVHVYGVVQREIDFFKVAAWLGMRLYHASGQTFSSSNLVAVLNELLVQEGRSLPGYLRNKISCMLAYDKSPHRLRGNDGQEFLYDELAIGMNGLYMVFKASAKVDTFGLALT